MKTTNPIFAGIPSETPSLRAAYEVWLKSQGAPDRSEPQQSAQKIDTSLNVGIIGGGMSGLYAALLLKSLGIQAHILEADSSRLGGRVYTYRFNSSPNQYFEAGAMRLPDIPEQQPVFALIDYLNNRVSSDSRINLIPYYLYDETGNRVFVNGTKAANGSVMTVDYANKHPEELGFTLAPPYNQKPAQSLINEVLQPFLKLLEEDFEAGFNKIVQYDNYSFRSYLAIIEGWPEELINYAEVMTSQTNQFENSFTELVIENMDFTRATWKSIENGMDRLPNACAEVIGNENITMGAQVYKLENTQDGRVAVYYRSADKPMIFDKVIAAVPPSVLKTWELPQWSSPKTQAIRALHFEPLYKIGIRFKSRFWERVSAPSLGGQSISDLPSRWFVYPSYGIKDDGPGVLLLYSWMTDAYVWLSYDEEDRIRIALRDLQKIYPEIDIQGEYIESFNVPWSEKWATGDAMFFPGQFKNLFNIARQPEGNIYFAGEHLSVHHTWIVGAIDSAIMACKQILGIKGTGILPLGLEHQPPHEYDYSGVFAANNVVSNV